MVNKVAYNLFVDRRMLKETRNCCEKNYLINKQLSVAEIDDGVVLPGKSGLGGVFSKTQGFIPHSAVYSGAGGIYVYDDDVLVNENAEVVYIGMMSSVWGHCLTDNLKHLWFVFDERYEHLKHLKWVYTMAYGNGFQSDDNFCMLLSHLGIDLINCIKIDRPTKFNRIYVPDDCFFDEDDTKYYTMEYKLIIDSLIDDICKRFRNSVVGDKVYFTRTMLKNNEKDYGEDKIELFFKEQGFEIYNPLDLTFDQQVSLLQSCNSFATTEGSIAHNAMFLKEGTQTIIIRKAHYCNGYQFAINQMKRLNVVIIDGHSSVCANPVFPWNGPFYLYVNRHLMDFFNCKRRISREGFIKYLSKNGFLFLKRYVKNILNIWKG